MIQLSQRHRRAGARVVESDPSGENLAAGTWQRLEELPDPHSPEGRIYPLACLIAIAVPAVTAGDLQDPEVTSGKQRL